MNPYSPPAASVMDIGSTLSQQDVLDFTGSEYYWQNWQAALEGRSKWTGFNWAATFFAVLWCLYRRMYGWAAFMFVGTTIFAAVVYMVLIMIATDLDQSQAETVATLGSLVIIRIAFGLFANRIYLRRALKSAAAVAHVVGDERSASLKAAGGLNETAMWIGFGASILMNVFSRLL